MPIQKAFATLVYRNALLPAAAKTNALNRQILKEAADILELDGAGQAWSAENYKNGFTSYGSANQLQNFSPTFAALEKAIDGHVKKFVRALDFNLGGRPLKMTNCWINLMGPNSHHGMHLHPLSVVSGTYYVQTPPRASAIKFEDPRLGLFMGAPPRKENCHPENRNFLSVEARAGGLVLFESWLRHEVPMYTGKQQRVSVSFNYGWGD